MQPSSPISDDRSAKAIANALAQFGSDYKDLVFDRFTSPPATIDDAASSQAPTFALVTNYFSREATLFWLRKHIAETFGDKICIWSGFDVQKTIPYGTPEDVRREARFLIDAYARKDGRFMLTLGNGATPDTPLASLDALLDEALTYGEKVIGERSRI